MDDDIDNEATSTGDSTSGGPTRPSSQGDDGLEQVRDQLAGLDDWEGLPDAPSVETISEASAAAGTAAVDNGGDGQSGEPEHDYNGSAENPFAEDGPQSQPTYDAEEAAGSDEDVVTLGGDLAVDNEEEAAAVASSDDVDELVDLPAQPEPEPGEPDQGNEPSIAAAAPAPVGPTGVQLLPEPEPIGPPMEEFGLEMRQVAGLTAGSSMKLPPGKTFQFNETTTSSAGSGDDSASFVLRVSDEGRVIVVPGTATAIVNETVVEEPTFVGNGILSVGSACFTVRPTRNATTASTLERAEVAMSAPRAIAVGEMNDDDDAEELFQSIQETRHLVAERHRHTHPDPEELKSRLSLMDPGLWERGRSHRFFGRYSVGYAIIPWQPKFDQPDRIPEHLHDPINKMSVLPWVPITASLTQGPIAIHGGRAAVLAACRHAVLSLAALAAPGDIRFSVVTGRDQVQDWQWTKSLPELMSPARNGNGSPADYYQLSVVDGSGHLEPAGLSVADAGPDYGIIVLGPNRSSVPDGCATYIAAGDDGTAIVTNHLGEEISATPIGVTEAFAHDMATRIADILIGYG